MKHPTSILAATILFGAFASPAKTETQVRGFFFHDTLQSYGNGTSHLRLIGPERRPHAKGTTNADKAEVRIPQWTTTLA